MITLSQSAVVTLNAAGAVLRGYFEGKRHAEDVLSQKFPQSGVALRPGFIHGTRDVGGIGIPLGLFGNSVAAIGSQSCEQYLASLSQDPEMEVERIPLQTEKSKSGWLICI